METRVPHAKKQCRHHGNNNDDQRTLHVVGIPDVYPSCCNPVGHKEEGLDGFKSRQEYVKLPPFFKRGFDLIYKSS